MHNLSGTITQHCAFDFLADGQWENLNWKERQYRHLVFSAQAEQYRGNFIV